jgi:RimJ/RimL family protein N-acetyltransferase
MGCLNDKPIGCIAVSAYDEKYGYIGEYIVLKKYRGKGYGLKLFKEAMNYLQGRIVALDSVYWEAETYKKSGFNFSYKTYTYSTRSKKI